MNPALIALLAILGSELAVVAAGVHLAKADRLRASVTVGRQRRQAATTTTEQK